jgi:hypothetical protein
MANHGKSTRPVAHNAPYRQAFERLDEALEKNTPWNNYEKIRLMRRAAFADVDAYQKSGKVVIPKYDHGS